MPRVSVANIENQERILDYLYRIYANIFDLDTMDSAAYFASRATGEENIPIVSIANIENQERALDYLQRIYANIFDLDTMDWSTYFASRATGEVYSTKFYNLSVSATCQGEKLDASVGKVCTPSVGDTEGRDDFAFFNAFWTQDCNFIVDENGVKKVTALEGQGTFTRYGKVDVGIITPPLYYGIEKVSDGEIWHLSDSPHPELGLVLMPHCRDNKGNAMPYGILPKYYAGEIDGVLYSSSGNRVKNFVSYQGLYADMQKKGAGYVGAGSERSIYLKTMLRIKYGASSSQAIFQGYTNYNYQYKVAQATMSQKYVVITKVQAQNLVVDSVVSVGDPNGNKNIDRGQSYMYNIANMARVTSIEIDGENAKVYLDTEPFTTTATTYVSTYPMYSGSTDGVPGRDGHVANDGKHPFKLQGLEEGIGAYMVSGNEIQDKDTATKTVWYNRNGGAYTADEATVKSDWKKVGEFTNPSSDGADFWIGETDIDLETGSETIRTTTTGSTAGTGDRCYWGGTGTGLREHLSRGNLWDSSPAGLSFLRVRHGLSSSSWHCAACVS